METKSCEIETSKLSKYLKYKSKENIALLSIKSLCENLSCSYKAFNAGIFNKNLLSNAWIWIGLSESRLRKEKKQIPR